MSCVIGWYDQNQNARPEKKLCAAPLLPCRSARKSSNKKQFSYGGHHGARYPERSLHRRNQRPLQRREDAGEGLAEDGQSSKRHSAPASLSHTPQRDRATRCPSRADLQGSRCKPARKKVRGDGSANRRRERVDQGGSRP